MNNPTTPPSQTPIRAVLFDYDDTLADTESARLDAMARTLAAVGVTSPAADALMAEFAGPLRGVPLQESMERFAVHLGCQEDLTQIYRRFYWHKERGLIASYPGVLQMLDELRRRGLLLGVVSSKLRLAVIEGLPAGVDVELGELGLIDYFPFRIGVNDVQRPKPDPEGVLTLLSRMGVPPSAALVVGDSVMDMAAARAAGCRSCLAAWGVRGQPYGPSGTAAHPGLPGDFVAASPAEVLRLIA